MHISELRLDNIGPIRRLQISPRFVDGRPVPVVLVGANGSGKSLTLSVVLDALIETKKKAWPSISEVKHDKYLRVSSRNYVSNDCDYSRATLTLKDEHTSSTFTEVVSRLDPKDLAAKYPSLFADGTLPNAASLPFYKNVIASGDLEKALRTVVLLYFPYFRYEKPAWLSSESSVAVALRERMFGEDLLSVIQANVAEDISRWIVDVVLDREIYERVTVPLNNLLPDIQMPTQALLYLGNAGPNTSTILLADQVLTTIVSARDQTITRARIGINQKGHRQVGVYATRGETEVQVAPTLAHLSSGELMLFSLFCSIVRAHDLVTGSPAQELRAITGVVAIDEIDLHLHISLQRDVLPRIMAMFPNVQFIITTHSPFFLLGMRESGFEVDVFSLPTGIEIDTEEFEEFQSGYDLFVSKNNQFKSAYLDLSQRLAHLARPLVITEGKTDWKHMKAAFSRLKQDGHYQALDLEWLEYEDLEMGDGTLAQMCEHFSRTPHAQKVLFVFDRDNPKVVAAMGGDQTLGYRSWGNSVFSCCIPTPSHRGSYTNISIEFYYTDDEIRTVDPTTGRRLHFTNEVELVARPGKRSGPRVLSTPVLAEENDKKIYDDSCESIRNAADAHVAHSKAVFAQRIIDRAVGYDGFKVDEFRKLFDVLSLIHSHQV